MRDDKMVSESAVSELINLIAMYRKMKIEPDENNKFVRDCYVSYFVTDDYEKLTALYDNGNVSFLLKLKSGFIFYFDKSKRGNDGTLEFYRDNLLIGYEQIKKDKISYRF